MAERLDEKDMNILMALQEGPQALKDLTILTKLEYENIKQRLQKLRKYGYIDRPTHGIYALTEKGRQLVRSISTPIIHDLENKQLQALIRQIPTELHQSFFRLAISGVIGKFHLFEELEGGYPAFVIGGPTKTFKTALAHLICHVLGFDGSKHIINVFAAVAGEVSIRRYKDKGKGFEVDISPYFNLDFICLDEVDKVIDRETKRNILHHLDGRRTFRAEGVEIENHSCAMLTLNTNPKKHKVEEKFDIHSAYIRRNIVADTGHVESELTNVDTTAREIFNSSFPRIKYKELLLTRHKLVDREYNFLEKMMTECVKSEFSGLVENRPLEVLTLGHSTLLGGDINRALFQTLWDRFVCLESLGGTVTGWRNQLARAWGEYEKVERPEILKQIKEAEQKVIVRQEVLEKQTAILEEKKVDKLESNYTLITQRRLFVEQIKAQVQKYKGSHPEFADALKKMWRDIESKVRSAEELERYQCVYNNYINGTVNPVIEEEQRQKDLELKKKQVISDIDTHLIQISDIAKRARGLGLIHIDSQIKHLEGDILPIKQKLENGEELSAIDQMTLSLMPFTFRIQVEPHKQTITAAEDRRRELESEKKLKLRQKKGELKVIDYYLCRKKLSYGEDPVLILQRLKILKPIGRLPSSVVADFVEGGWFVNLYTGKYYYEPPYHDFQGGDGKQYKSYKEVRLWTDWPAMRPLLQVKKEQLLSEIKGLSS